MPSALARHRQKIVTRNNGNPLLINHAWLLFDVRVGDSGEHHLILGPWVRRRILPRLREIR